MKSYFFFVFKVLYLLCAFHINVANQVPDCQRLNGLRGYRKIHGDKQNKHISGKHNFVQGGGIIEIESSNLEFLLKT